MPDFHMVAFLSGISPRMRLQLRAVENLARRICYVWQENEMDNPECREMVGIATPFSASLRKAGLKSIGALVELFEYAFRARQCLLPRVKANDIVQLNHPFLLFMVPALKKAGVRVIYDAPEFDAVMYRSMGWRGVGLAWLVDVCERLFLSKVDFLFCVTSKDSWFRHHLEQRSGKQVIELWNLPSQEIVTRAKLIALPDMLVDKRIVAYVGGLHEQKGSRLFPDVVKRVVAERGDVRFLIIGSIRGYANASEWLREQGIEDFCWHVPWCTQEEMFGWLLHAHLGLILSQPEGTHTLLGAGGGRKLFTYMAAGVPVVAPDFSEAWEIVSKEGIGVRTDTTSARSVANAITSLLERESELQTMSKKAKAVFRDKYSWEKERDKYCGALYSLNLSIL